MTAGVLINYGGGGDYFNTNYIGTLIIRGAHNGSNYLNTGTSTIDLLSGIFLSTVNANMSQTYISDVRFVTEAALSNGLLFDLGGSNPLSNNNIVTLSRCSLLTYDVGLGNNGFVKLTGPTIFTFEGGGMYGGLPGDGSGCLIKHFYFNDLSGNPNRLNLVNTNLIKGNPGPFIRLSIGTNTWDLYNCSLDNVTMYDTLGPDFSDPSIYDENGASTGQYGLSIESGIITNLGYPGSAGSGSILNITFQPFILSKDLRNPIW
jgi:hypothetical protein